MRLTLDRQSGATVYFSGDESHGGQRVELSMHAAVWEALGRPTGLTVGMNGR